MMNTPEDHLRAFLQMVLATAPEEIDCDEFLNSAAVFLERARGMNTLPPELCQTAQHLDVCPDCREEFEALLELYGVSRGKSD